MKRVLLAEILMVIVVGLLLSGCVPASTSPPVTSTPMPLEQYKKNYEIFKEALVSRIAWYSKAVEVAEATYEVPTSAIEEVKVVKIIEVEEREAPKYVIKIVKGLNRTDDLIELRVKNYKDMNKVEVLCLYKDTLQAYLEEEFIEHELQLKFENYENSELSFTIGATPYDVEASPTWDAPINVVVVEKGIKLADTVTLQGKCPKIIYWIINEIAPRGWVPIAAFDPHMLGAVIPKDALEMIRTETWWKVVLCVVGSAASDVAANSGGGAATVAVGCFNVIAIGGF